MRNAQINAHLKKKSSDVIHESIEILSLFPTDDEKAALIRKYEKHRKPLPAMHVCRNTAARRRQLKQAIKLISKFYSKSRRVKGTLAVKIRATYRDDEGNLQYVKLSNLEKIAFTCKPEFTGTAEGLDKLGTIFTYHKFDASSFFKPRIAEVLAQIPDKFRGRAVDFEVMSSDLTSANVLPNGYHETETILYAKDS